LILVDLSKQVFSLQAIQTPPPMRTARIKVSSASCTAVYHVMTRTVNGAFLFDDPAKEILRRQLWQIADFCGVTILTYTILENHFHILVRIPQSSPVSDAELLRRYNVLYPKPTRFQQARLEVVQVWLKNGDPEGEAWRKRQLSLMGDVSQFMKLLKQRFSVWFNHTHNRYGTLWSERFKSVLVEPSEKVVETMAAYIDLNAVRAGLVSDPKDYRFCGYGEAVAGGKLARAGLRQVLGGEALPSWTQAQAGYRLTLFGTSSSTRPGKGAVSPGELARVVKAEGRLPVSTVLRCRIRHFTDGAVIGGQLFVAAHLATYRERTGRRRNSAPKPLPALADWGADLVTLRGLRRDAFG
jgi:REP element-mobilizing transposase RayT